MTYDPRYYVKRCHECGRESENRTLVNISKTSTKRVLVFVCAECAEEHAEERD